MEKVIVVSVRYVQDLSERREELETWVTLGSPVNLVTLDSSELQVTVESLDQPDRLDPAETSDSPASWVRSVRPVALAVWVSRVDKDSPASRALSVRRETAARQDRLDARVRRESRARPVSRGRRVASACRDRSGSPASLATRAGPETPDLPVVRETSDPPVNAVSSDSPDVPVVRDSLERPAPQVSKETSGSLDCEVSRDWPVTRDVPDQWAPLDNREHVVIRVRRDLLDSKDSLDPLDRQDLTVSAAVTVLVIIIVLFVNAI